MDRRSFLVGVGVGVLAVPLAAEAQQPETPARIAVVFGVSPLATMVGAVPAHPYVRALLGGLRDLGYVEGQNIVIERRSLEGNYDRASEVVAELIRLKVQVIVAAPADVARAARRATTTLPMVVGDATDEGEDPLIASLARPGGNVTGMGQPPPELSQKRLEVFKEAVPGISRVVVLTDGAPQQTSAIRDLEAAARVLRLSLSSVEIKSVDHVGAALEVVRRQHPHALMDNGGAPLFAARRHIVAFALRQRLPMISVYREFVEEGALMSYHADPGDRYRRTATYVDKILKGAKPADLPVERPTKYELVINLKTAKALGLTIPPSLLLRADQVIE